MNTFSLRSIKACLAVLATCWPFLAAQSAQPLDAIVTGPETGTYIKIGQDIAKHVAQREGITLRVLPSKGSIENIERLRYEPGVRMALVQSDVYGAYTNLMRSGNLAAGKLIEPLRVVLPLYDEEIYMVVRANSTLNSLRDIRGKRINIGPIGSGTAMTAMTLYSALFDETIPAELISTDPNEVALGKLANDDGPEVVVVVSGQPVGLFTNMTPSVEENFKLLRFDASNPIEGKALLAYKSAVLERKNYPKWISQDMPVLSVKTLLVTFDYNTARTRNMLTRLSKGICNHFQTLQTEGHVKWKQVSLDLPELGVGWRYYPPTANSLNQCAKKDRPSVYTGPCSRQEEVMGFCTRRP